MRRSTDPDAAVPLPLLDELGRPARLCNARGAELPHAHAKAEASVAVPAPIDAEREANSVLVEPGDAAPTLVRIPASKTESRAPAAPCVPVELYVGIDVHYVAVPTTTVNIGVRPPRIATLVRAESLSDLVAAVAANTQTWGGSYNPIIAVGGSPEAAVDEVALFRADLLTVLGEATLAQTAALDQLQHLEYRRLMRDPFQRHGDVSTGIE